MEDLSYLQTNFEKRPENSPGAVKAKAAGDMGNNSHTKAGNCARHQSTSVGIATKRS